MELAWKHRHLRRECISPHAVVTALRLWANRPPQPHRRLPVVLAQPEVEALLAAFHGIAGIMAMELYGSGFRLMECLQLRVKDIDFTRSEILAFTRRPSGLAHRERREGSAP